jgi:hypothetical protein
VQAEQDTVEKQALLHDAHTTLEAAVAMPGVLANATPEQRSDASVRLPSNAERAAGLAAWAIAQHRLGGEEGGRAGQEVRASIWGCFDVACA